MIINSVLVAPAGATAFRFSLVLWDGESRCAPGSVIPKIPQIPPLKEVQTPLLRLLIKKVDNDTLRYYIDHAFN